MMIPDRTAQTTVLRSGVAILAAALLGAFVTVAVAPRRTWLADLAVFGGYRCVEPRLSIDVPHAAFRLVPAGERQDMLRHRDPHLFSAAVAAMPRNRGLVHLLFGESEPAIKSLTNPIDLSAAHYMRGLASESLNDFGRALQALSGAPDSPAVRFNRALILEQLADAEAAAAEWKRYLSLDESSEWAVEARQHLEIDSRPSTPEAWRADKPRLIKAATAGDMPRVRQLLARYPLGARHLVELELLPGWGRGEGERSLIAARRIVSVLAEKGEHLLRDAIAEIDAAPPERKAMLAKAYVAYAEGHQALDIHADHDRALVIDQTALKLGDGYPAFAGLVVDDVATARYRKYRSARAQIAIDQTRMRYANHRADYVALFARLDWLTGLIQFVGRDVSASLQSYDRSLAAYETLGEAEYQAAQEINIASALAYLGENERASVHWRKALILASKSEDPRRLYAILTNAADAALEESAPAAALAFQDRFVRLARTTGEPLRVGHALVARSSIFSRAGRRADALHDIAEVDRLKQQIIDLPSRQRLEAEASTVEALARRDVDDRAVIGSLTHAIELLRNLKVPMTLPQLLLERGRAHLRLGETNAAELDFRAGIAELETQRRQVKEADLRVTYFDRADRLFVDLALFLLRRARPEEAFDLLERSRSRELLDQSSGQPMMPMSVAEIRSHLPKGTIVVTHTLTARTLITCVVTRDGVRAFEQPGGEAAVIPLLDAIAAGFASPPAQLPQRELRSLGALLIDRVALPVNSRIVFVPDQLLYNAPFAALRTATDHYLVEDQTVIVAPSATLYVRNCDRDRMLQARGAPSLLAIASPQKPKGFENLTPLSRAPDEARRVADNYPDHRVVVASQASQPPLLSLARRFDAVHFATHGIVDLRDPARSALLIGENDRITATDVESAALPHVRLVVLGGCNTGVGKSHRSEGAMSLARAFMAALVPTVVGTVAPIEDDAAERLLTKFHRAYSGGLDAAAALRRAQLQLLRGGNPADANPAQWAAFEVIGGAYAPQREREEVAQSWPLR
jgi:tetratricopeptide (TPR) repeat protein